MAEYYEYNTTTTPTGIPDPTNTSTTPVNRSLDQVLRGGVGGPSDGLQTVLGVVLTAMLAVVVFSLGCTVETSRLWAHLRRPWGVLVGLGCQFGLMPLTAFLLASGLGVQPLQAVAVLVMGCCPGGVISNIVTYWLDGDMDLRYCGCGGVVYCVMFWFGCFQVFTFFSCLCVFEHVGKIK